MCIIHDIDIIFISYLWYILYEKGCLAPWNIYTLSENNWTFESQIEFFHKNSYLSQMKS